MFFLKKTQKLPLFTEKYFILTVTLTKERQN